MSCFEKISHNVHSKRKKLDGGRGSDTGRGGGPAGLRGCQGGVEKQSWNDCSPLHRGALGMWMMKTLETFEKRPIDTERAVASQGRLHLPETGRGRMQPGGRTVVQGLRAANGGDGFTGICLSAKT